MSFLDLDERLIDLAQQVKFLVSPLTDLKEFLPADITLVEGAVANEEHVEQIHLIRKRTKTLIALGDCAVTGNVTAMRNLFGLDDVLNRAYRETSTRVQGIPDGSEIVPRLIPRVKPIHEFVKVDYFLQGCPPPADAIYELLASLLRGEQPNVVRRFG